MEETTKQAEIKRGKFQNVYYKNQKNPKLFVDYN